MSAFEVSVTICSWNTLDDLRACLASLDVERGLTPLEVLVVDNASTDGSPDMVESEFPWVRLFRQSKNLGFTGGQNLAIRNREAGPAFLLNSDTVVHPGCLRTLLDYVSAHTQVGIVGPKLLNPDGSLQHSCRRFPNPYGALFRNTFLGKLFPNHPLIQQYLMKDFDHKTVRSVDWVSGAAMLVSENALNLLGGFDESFFMYCEDVDLCYRCHEAGLDVVYVPDALVTHAIGRSTDQVADKMIVRHHKSMLHFYRKHMALKSSPIIRRLAVAGAAVALTLRACLPLLKNRWDALRRWLRR